MPKTFLEAERSARAVTASDRMLAQIYGATVSRQTDHEDVVIEDEDFATYGQDGEDEDDPWQKILEEKLNRLADAQAKKADRWSDSTPFDVSLHQTDFEDSEDDENLSADDELHSSISPNQKSGEDERTLNLASDLAGHLSELSMNDDDISDLTRRPSIFSTDRPSWQKPCNCSISKPRCGRGPCPLMDYRVPP